MTVTSSRLLGFREWKLSRVLRKARVTGELAKLSSIWLQLIWMTVGSTVKTRDLLKLNNNSIPTAPTIRLSDGWTLSKTRGGKKGQIRPMIRFVQEFSAARVTTGFRIAHSTSRLIFGLLSSHFVLRPSRQ